MSLNKKQTDLKALFLNCTLKRSPELSHTDGLINISKVIMEKNKIAEEVIPGIEAKKISGYRKIEVLRTEHEHEVEFVTIMTYDSLKSVIGLQGTDYKKYYVPDIAQAVLKRWNKEAAHYELIDTRNYQDI